MITSERGPLSMAALVIFERIEGMKLMASTHDGGTEMLHPPHLAN